MTTATRVGFLAIGDAMQTTTSEPFEGEKVEPYKEVQWTMSNGLTPVIELTSTDGARLDDETIALFGTDVA